MEVGEAFSLIRSAIDAGRPANGYLVVGGVRGSAADLTERILRHLYPDGGRLLEANAHPDVVRLEPEGKKRIITVKAMRERLVAFLAQTSYSGGWKVGVVTCADRLNDDSANAFLKNLEEPTPKTMFLLLTEQPDMLLPTVVSRCQRIDLPMPSGLLEADAYKAVAAVFATTGPKGSFEKGMAAKRLAEVLAGLRKDAADEDEALVRKAFFRTILSFVRGWMVNGCLPLHQAFANVEAVEAAVRRVERSVSEDAALSFLLERLVFP